ncbi:MAG: hypothetical protein R3315_00515 [Woeseiaceae bacterium]|nr:hypothetical protein [Woeseiaceae bacterium]
MRALLLLAALGLVAGCGGPVDMTCDEVRLYQEARERPRLRVPEDLDPPDPAKEIPLPEASPRQARPAGSPCLDMPPAVQIGE